MVIGVFQTKEAAEAAVDQLAEADFGNGRTVIIAADRTTAALIGDTVVTLDQLGLSQAQLGFYRSQLDNNAIIVGVKTVTADESAAAAETMRDMHAASVSNIAL